MSISLNRNSIIWAIGVMQPVSTFELNAYLASVFQETNSVPDENLLHQFVMEEMKLGFLVRISRRPDLFSLTLKGHHSLTKAQRKLRDRERIFLLRASWGGRLQRSREMLTSSLGGDAPSLSFRTSLEGSEARAAGPSIPQSRPPWPRHSKQLFDPTGSSSTSRDSYIQLLSYDNPNQLLVARGEKNRPWADFTSLGLMLGISPQLILQIYARPERHYRVFTIPKKSGKPRIIEAPRVFLKLIQKFIADYLMYKIPVHSTVHSFSIRKSIVTNAENHIGKRWVANLDIVDFFNSITTGAVNALFERNGFDPNSAKVLAALTTYLGHLPQGSPASPAISNAILFDFDNEIAERCSKLHLSYTRYADDITISGNSLVSIKILLDVSKQTLQRNYGLHLHAEKERIISNYSQQRVTGVVVNDKAMPPRKLRREIKAALHNAWKSENLPKEEIIKLEGYISHFRSFPEFRNSNEFLALTKSLAKVQSARKSL